MTDIECNQAWSSRRSRSRTIPRRHPSRQGAVLIELAVSLPLLTLIVLLALEAMGLTFARQAMVQTAYEAAVIAVRREASNADAIAAAQAVTNGRLLSSVTIEFNPADVSSIPRGTPLTVTASVPAAAARRIGSGLLPIETVSASATMVKE
jgi:Flp pilus assembly protein TadG